MTLEDLMYLVSINRPVMTLLKNVEIFFAFLNNELDLTTLQIYTANKTGLFWCCLPSSTSVDSDESSVTGFRQNTFT